MPLQPRPTPEFEPSSLCLWTRALNPDEAYLVEEALDLARTWADRTNLAGRALAVRAGNPHDIRCHGPSAVFDMELRRLFRIDATSTRSFRHVTRVTYVVGRVATILRGLRSQHFLFCHPAEGNTRVVAFVGSDPMEVNLTPGFFRSAAGSARRGAGDLVHEAAHLAGVLRRNEIYSRDLGCIGTGVSQSVALTNAETFACLVYSVGQFRRPHATCIELEPLP